MSELIHKILSQEADSQMSRLSLVPEHNYVSKAVQDLLGSVLVNTFSSVDLTGVTELSNTAVLDLEREAISLAKELFSTDYHVNLRSNTVTNANLAVLFSVLKPGETILILNNPLRDNSFMSRLGDHLKGLYTLAYYNPTSADGLFDYEEILAEAKSCRPALIVASTESYPYLLDFPHLARITRECGAWLLVDVSSVVGLIAGRNYPSPLGLVDFVTSSASQSLRGPEAGMIFSRPEFAKAIDKQVYPVLQSGVNTALTAALIQVFSEALQPSFSQYAKQSVINTRALAYYFQQHGLGLFGEGTDTNYLIVDLGCINKGIEQAKEILAQAGLLVSTCLTAGGGKGLLLGTASLTSRGMKEKEFETIAEIITGLLTGSQEIHTAQTSLQSLVKKYRISSYY